MWRGGKLQPLKQQRGGRAARSVTVSAPVGGLNKRDSLVAMPSTDAAILKNLFPEQQMVVVRPGYEAHCDTGIKDPIRTLAEFEYNGVHKLLAAVGGSIFDVTGDTANLLVSGLDTNASNFVTCNFGGRQFWLNGVDAPLVFDGTSMGPTGFTGSGLTLSSLDYVHVHGSRLYFAQSGTQTVWYGGTEAISGALSSFDLSLTGNFGGDLFAITSISRDGGAGPDDHLVFIFESGDCAVYRGTDPGNASNFSRVGLFKIGRPLSRRAVFEFDSETYVLTDRGCEPLSAVLPFGSSAQFSEMLSDKIRDDVLKNITTHGSNEDWSLCAWPRGQMLFVQTPSVSSSAGFQHVMNLNEGAWCEFDLPIRSMSRFGSDLYIGGVNGQIFKFGDAVDDDGSLITAELQTAWNYFHSRGSNKRVTLVRVHYNATATPTVGIGLGSDFVEPKLSNVQVVGSRAGAAYFGDAHFGEAYFSPGQSARAVTYPLNNIGHAFALRIRILGATERVGISSITYVYEPGGLL